MILTLDIGNTSITCGVFDNENLVKKFSLPSNTDLTVIDYGEMLSAELGSYEFDGAIIGSVVDELNNRIQYAVLAQFGVMAVMLSHESEMPISLAIENRSELGADRLANAVRAFNLYKKAVIVVDFGTATTFDIVNSKGEFIGGCIVAGVETQIK
jgi:type III pantothenate kinase